MSDVQLMQAEIGVLVAKLEAIGDHGRKAAKAAFKDAGSILIAAIQGRAPVSDRPHYRYASSGRRAAPGKGKRVATYAPGNLRRSFKILPLRRTQAVFIGPKVAKGSASGTFVGARTDAFYAAMVEFGTRRMAGRYFVTTAEVAAGAQTLRVATELLRRAVNSHAQKQGLK